MRSGWMKAAFLGFSLVGCLALSACASHDKTGSKTEIEENDEMKVPIDQVPAPVKDTIASESGGVAVTSVDKETKDGKDVYEADAVINGTNYEIKVAADGKLLSKKIDNEDNEKKGSEEKDEKKEKDKD